MDGFHIIHLLPGFRMRRRGWRREYFYESIGRGEYFYEFFRRGKYLFAYAGDWRSQRDRGKRAGLRCRRDCLFDER
jgi:hypothetical protein